jgi:cytochrome c nitrite reductase small subunit
MPDLEPVNHSHLSVRSKLLLFVAVMVFPAVLSLVTMSVSFQRAKSVEFCASCHVMAPFVNDLADRDSENLASMHWNNRWINKDPCYTCHTDYDFLGPVTAKMNGLRHITAYYLMPAKAELRLYKPFKNQNCLKCHAEQPVYLDNIIHEMSAEEILSGETSCLECHESIHPEQPGAIAAAEGEGGADE